MLRITVKIFWSCIYVDIPSVLIEEEMGQARLWLQVRVVLMTRLCKRGAKPCMRCLLRNAMRPTVPISGRAAVMA